jgi:Coenzyme PQQ synthesis protein D (PqqD)
MMAASERPFRTSLSGVTRLRLRQRSLEWRQVDDEVVALDLETARYLSTNPSGALLWHELATGATREDLVARLRAKWGVDEARATADVDAFLALLRQRGLLESA